MSALDDVIHYHADNCQSGSECDLSALSRAELAQLRVAASEAQAAHVYLDESPVNDPNDPPLELAERAARLVDEILQLRANLQAAQERIAEQARQLDEARIMISMINQKTYLKRDLQVEINHWLAANPEPKPQPPNGEGRP